MVRGQTLNKPPILQKGLDFDAKIHNRFDIEVVDARTGEIKSLAKGFNVICNNLWSRLCSGNTYFNYIFYGRGTGTPSPSDTSLFDHIGGAAPTAADDVVNVDYNAGVFSYQRKIQLSESTAVGETISEVGIAYGSTATYLCTHAMLEDMNGNPISIVKTSTDIINIYATVFVHFAGGGFDNGSIRMNYYDASYNLLRMFAGLSMTNGTSNRYFVATRSFVYSTTSNWGNTAVYPEDMSPYDDRTLLAAAVSFSYSPEDKTIKLTANRFPVAAANIGGILYFTLAYMSTLSESSSKPAMMYPDLFILPGGSWFPYSDIKNEAVGTGDGSTVDYALDFPYAHDVEVYVDGNLSTDVKVDYAVKPYSSDNRIDRALMWLNSKTTNPDVLIPEYVTSQYLYGTLMFYNPMHEMGISKIDLSYSTLYASNDLSTWETAVEHGSSTATINIPEAYQHHKYWKAVKHPSTPSNTNGRLIKIMPIGDPSKVVHFTTPPAEGAVITANYKSDCFAKDENHVFDLSITFHFGEHTES